MDFLRALFYRSALVRLGTRAVVVVIAAYPLLLIARRLERLIPLVSLPTTIALLCGFILIEATLIVIMKLMFRRVR
jgi:hypothetical protein